MMHRAPRMQRGFTLIELSIVLVIIGLIVGGVLVGQDLIRAAEIRAQISQIEQYNTAVNTFRGKYNALPGDMNAATASQFGFTQPGIRNTSGGQGDGNGVIDGCTGYGSASQGCGETGVFWEDLSSSAAGSLIPGSFSTANISAVPGSTISGMTLAFYFPAAKLGRGNYIYVFEQGGINFLGIANITSVNTSAEQFANPSMTVAQAYGIDKKVDDGFAQTGNVVATYVNADMSGYAATWAAGSGSGTADTSATPGSATTCYDNGNVGGAVQQFSMEINGGSGVNCALSFRFQ